VREALEAGGVASLAGRVERPGFAELLDIADFEAGPWRVEVRMVPEAVISGPADAIQSAGQPELIIPTMPLMVGVLADFYLGVTVDRQLTRLSMLGFVGQSDLARAELSRNGLYLRVGPGQLSPFSLLPDFLRLPRPLNAEYLAFVEAWQERATALVEQLRGVIEREDGIALSAAAGRRIVDLVREQLWSIQCGSLEADPGACQGSWMMKSGLAPLFERLREVFGLAWPLPELDDDPIAFRNMVADQERIAAAGVGNLLEALLRDQLPVVERVALYRHLLTDQGAIRQLQADRRVLDHVTNGRHQSLPGRIGQIERRVERLSGGDFAADEVGAGGFETDEVGRLAAGVERMRMELESLRTRLVAGERQRLLGQLAAGFAHELRNAITGAKLAIDLHRRRCRAGAPQAEASPADESLAVASRQLDIVEEEVRGLLTLGVPPTTAAAPVDLVRLVGEVRDLVGPRAMHAGVTVAGTAACRGEVTGRKDGLRAALVNLALNAIDAAGDRGSVTVGAESIASGIALVVEDDGPGPPAAIAAALHEPFVTGKQEGVGLGLAVAKAVAEQHGGTLAWSRTAGRTRFEIRLPATAIHGEPVA